MRLLPYYTEPANLYGIDPWQESLDHGGSNRAQTVGMLCESWAVRPRFAATPFSGPGRYGKAPAMRMWAGAQLHLIPLALLIGAMIYPFIGHFEVNRTSPIFATKAEADRWLADTARAARCLPAVTHAEAVAELSTPDTPWYGKLQCRQKRITLKFVSLFVLPWLALNLVMAVTAWIPRKSKRTAEQPHG